MSALVSVALFYTTTDIFLWDVPGDVLAAPASALCGWKGVNPPLQRRRPGPGRRTVFRLVAFLGQCGLITLMRFRKGSF